MQTTTRRTRPPRTKRWINRIENGVVHACVLDTKGVTHDVKFDERDLSLWEAHTWFTTKVVRSNQSPAAYLCRSEPIEDAYAACRGKRHIYFHREVLDAPDHLEGDHVNGDGLDNRRANLRLCTHKMNMRNRAQSTTHRSSPVRGVTWCKQQRQWMARVTLPDGTQVNLGRFDSLVEAATVRVVAERKHSGNFAAWISRRDYGDLTEELILLADLSAEVFRTE